MKVLWRPQRIFVAQGIDVDVALVLKSKPSAEVPVSRVSQMRTLLSCSIASANTLLVTLFVLSVASFRSD